MGIASSKAVFSRLAEFSGVKKKFVFAFFLWMPLSNQGLQITAQLGHMPSLYGL